MRDAIEFILKHQEPYPAFVINRRWEVVLANDAAVRMNRFLMQGRPLRHSNMLHQVFDPEDFRPVIVNWPEVAGRFISLLHEDIAGNAIAVADHCYGCTAGQGSSCGGALA